MVFAAASLISVSPRLHFSSLLSALHVKCVEVDRLKQKLGKAALLYQGCNGLTRIGKQDVRAKAAKDGLQLFTLIAGDLEQSGLLQFGQETRLVFFLGFDGDRQNDLVDVALQLIMRAAKVEVGQRFPVALLKYFGRSG